MTDKFKQYLFIIYSSLLINFNLYKLKSKYLFMNNKIFPAIIGLGYVGLPAFLRLNRKFNTVGFDVNLKRVKDLKNFQDINSEFNKKELKLKNNSIITHEKNLLKKCNFYIVTVPTPIYPNNKPDIRPLNLACKIIARNINDGDIIFFESTVYPGLTEDLKKKFFYKKKIWLGYSPERINPGDKNHTIKNIKKIVSIEKCPIEIKKKVFSIYKTITKNLVISNSIKNAEMSKVIENVQRDINIAFMNEILLVCEKLKINFKEVVKLAKTKWNFLNFSPGLVGGHCLPVDPFYLYHISKLKGHNAKFMLAGREVNNYLKKFLENKIKDKIIKNRYKNVLVCGVTYKPNVSDLRNSLSLKIFLNLKKIKNIKVTGHDPTVDKISSKNYKIKLQIKDFKRYDLIVVLVKHDIFLKKLKKYKNKHPDKFLDFFNLIN